MEIFRSFTCLKKKTRLPLLPSRLSGFVHFKKIANDLSGRLRCIYLDGSAPCQQIGVILAGGVQQVKRGDEVL